MEMWEDKALLRKIFEEDEFLTVIHFLVYLVVPESVRDPLKCN